MAMDSTLARRLAARAREKRAEVPSLQQAVTRMHNAALQSEALRDVGALGLGALGVGGIGRGLVGLVNLASRRSRPAMRSGPAELPLPYPVEADEDEPQKRAGIAENATIKPGIPWYGPAMLAAGMGGLGAGWAGMDAVLDARRRRDRADELSRARQEFHDALIGQYTAPLGGPAGPGTKRGGDDRDAMAAAAGHLDRAFDALEKRGWTWSDVAGAGLGAYGMYALPAALAGGTIGYDKAQKRSRRSVIAKALQRREQRRYMEQPPEIYARPEPIVLPRPQPAPLRDTEDDDTKAASWIGRRIAERRHGRA